MQRISKKLFQKIPLLGALAILASASGLSAATLTTSVTARTGCAGPDTGFETASGADAISVSLNTGEASCASAAKAAAGGGYVSARGNLSSTVAPTSGNDQLDAGGSSFMGQIDITPGVGQTEAQLLATYGQFINITVNASLTGTLGGLIAQTETPSRNVSASISASVQLVTAQGSDLSTASANYGFNTNLDDFVTGTSIVGESITATVLADWRQSVNVNFRLSGAAFINGSNDTDAFADFNAGNSLTFSKDGPAFILPVGFTVNAPELNIFDNRWIDPRIAPVPLPAGLPFLLGAVGLLGLIRKAAGRHSGWSVS